jgi:hypothetical protein
LKAPAQSAETSYFVSFRLTFPRRWKSPAGNAFFTLVAALFALI